MSSFSGISKCIRKVDIGIVSKVNVVSRRDLRTNIDKIPWNWKNGLLPVYSPKALDITLNTIIKKNLRTVNEMVQGSDLETATLVDLIKITSENSTDATLHTQACSLWNNSFVLHCLIPGGRDPSPEMQGYIRRNFGSFDALKSKIQIHARGLVGNGFVWLIDNKGSLEVIATPNYSTPLIWSDCMPILGISLWQHSYFLDHKENINGYVENWFKTINWQAVEDHVLAAGPMVTNDDWQKQQKAFDRMKTPLGVYDEDEIAKLYTAPKPNPNPNQTQNQNFRSNQNPNPNPKTYSNSNSFPQKKY